MNELEENKRIVQRYLDAFNSGNHERILNSFNDDLDYWVPGDWQMSGHFTKTDLARMLKEFDGKLDEPIKLTATGFTAEDDRVAVEAVSTGKLKGRTYANTYHILVVIKDGKISRWHEHLDSKCSIEFFLG